MIAHFPFSKAPTGQGTILSTMLLTALLASPFSVLAVFLSLSKRAFSAFRSALLEAPLSSLIYLTTNRYSAIEGSFPYSLASFFHLFTFLRASFRSLPLFSLATKLLRALTSLVDKGFSILSSAPDFLNNFLSLFASLRFSFESLLSSLLVLSIFLFDLSSRSLFCDFWV